MAARDTRTILVGPRCPVVRGTRVVRQARPCTAERGGSASRVSLHRHMDHHPPSRFRRDAVRTGVFVISNRDVRDLRATTLYLALRSLSFSRPSCRPELQPNIPTGCGNGDDCDVGGICRSDAAGAQFRLGDRVVRWPQIMFRIAFAVCSLPAASPLQQSSCVVNTFATGSNRLPVARPREVCTSIWKQFPAGQRTATSSTSGGGTSRMN